MSVFFNPQTSHYYEYVSTSDSLWNEAKTQADSKTYNELPGYLATITSNDENNFIHSIAPNLGWLGGSDQELEGMWKWADGSESGTVINYTNWSLGEPNNYPYTSEGEDYLHTWSDGTWNDLPYFSRLPGYFVEYGNNLATVPDPSFGMALFVIAAISLFWKKHVIKN